MVFNDFFLDPNRIFSFKSTFSNANTEAWKKQERTFVSLRQKGIREKKNADLVSASLFFR